MKAKKISKIKRNNQKKTKLLKQGKIKHKKVKPNVPVKEVVKAKCESSEEESDHGEDLLGMVDEDDLEFLKQSVLNRSYSMFRKIRISTSESSDKTNKKRKRNEENLEGYEENYEKDLNEIKSNVKPKKMMLPIKTKDGLVERTMDVNEDETKSEEENKEEDEEEEEKDSDVEDEINFEDDLDETRPLAMAELLSIRQNKINQIRFRIGIICSGVLEDPENKIGILRHVLKFMDCDMPEVYLSVRKIAATSLCEVFKDIIPAYPIREQNTNDVKLKKGTLILIKYEENLLRMYKSYLQKLEKIISILTPKIGNTTRRTSQELKTAEICLGAMTQLLLSHPTFNYAKNIIQVIVPFLNHRLPNIRATIRDTIKQIFKEDKKAETTLHIMSKINALVKQKVASLHVEVLETLLSLRIKEVNLDQEKEHELKQKKLMSHKQNVLQLSKKERKRKKKLEELNKELLETQAEENKSVKEKLYTEITKILFTIYFRILKQSPRTKILSITLEGLARFAHLINLDFYADLVEVINSLLETKELGYREQLHCVLTVVTILSGQGDVLNIDPLRFYAHLYKILFDFHAGKSHNDFGILLQTLYLVLVGRRKKNTSNRLVSFTKRLATLSLQGQHNSTLGCMALIKSVLQLVKSVDILLDCDPSVGDGKYLPESMDPEFTNANNSALWELPRLVHHYHPTVRKMAQYLAAGVPVSGEASLAPELKKMSPEELFLEFDSGDMAFKPAIPPPGKPVGAKSKSVRTVFVNGNFEKYCNNVLKTNNHKVVLAREFCLNKKIKS